MIKAIVIFDHMPKPNHNVRIGAKAKTGTDCEKTKIGLTKARAVGENAKPIAETKPSNAPKASPINTSAIVMAACSAKSALSFQMVSKTNAGGGKINRATPVDQTSNCHKVSAKRVAAIDARQPLNVAP